LARGLGRPDLVARCLNVAYVLWDLGEHDRGERSADEARQLYAALGNQALELDCLCQLTGIATHRGQHALGVERGRLAVAMADELGNVWGQMFSRYHLAGALIDAGDLDAARGLVVDALERVEAGMLAGSQPNPLLLALCRTVLGGVERMRGDVQAALRIHLENACDGLARVPSVFPDDADDPPLALSFADFVGGVSFADLCADHAVLGQWQAACLRCSTRLKRLCAAINVRARSGASITSRLLLAIALAFGFRTHGTRGTRRRFGRPRRRRARSGRSARAGSSTRSATDPPRARSRARSWV
jgi:hypothetical protein